MKTLLYIPMIFLSLQAFNQEVARFTVFAGDADRSECPVGIDLAQVNYNLDGGALTVLEIVGDTEIVVSSQLESGHSAKLWIMLSGETPRGTSRSFILQQKGQQHQQISRMKA